MGNVCLIFEETLFKNCIEYWPWYLGYIIQGAIAQSENQAIQNDPYPSAPAFSLMWQRGHKAASKGNIKVGSDND